MDVFRKLDMFGEQISFEENDSKSLKTVQGAVLTIIITSLTISIGFLFGQDIYKRNDPVTRITEVIQFDNPIYTKDFPFLLAVFFPNGTITNPDDYFDISYTTYSFDYSGKITIKVKPMIKCDSKNLTNLKSIMQQGPCEGSNKCLCVNEEDNAFLVNTMLTLNSQYIHITVNECDNKKRQCLDSSILRKNYFINMFYPKVYIDSEDYENPVKYYASSVPNQFSDAFYKRVYVYVTSNQLISDNGYLLNSNSIINYLSVTNTKAELLQYTKGITPLAAISVATDVLSGRYYRSYMKIQDLLAKIGGFFNALYIFSYILSFHYIRFLYIKKIYKETNIDFINNRNKTLTATSKIRESDFVMKNNFVNLNNLRIKEPDNKNNLPKDGKFQLETQKIKDTTFNNKEMIELNDFDWNYSKYLFSISSVSRNTRKKFQKE